MVSLWAFEFNAMKKEISRLKRVQQVLCDALTSMTEKRDYYMQEAGKDKKDAECARLTPCCSAAKVSKLSFTTEKRSKTLTAGKAILYELSRKTFQTYWFPYVLNAWIP